MPVLAGAFAGWFGAGVSHAQTPASVTLTQVYSTALPAGGDPAVVADGAAQYRGIALNANVGSPWHGTFYMSRRQAGVQAVQVYYFAKNKVISATGPDFTAPTGKFITPATQATLLAAGYDIATTNSFWPIAVSGDDYVYVGGLTAGKVARFNPDGTNPVVVVAGGFPRARSMRAYGKGINTVIYLVKDGGANPSIEKWTASAVDGTGAPTAFTQHILFVATDGGDQYHQAIINNAGTHIYYAKFGGDTGTGGAPRRYTMAGVQDAAFTANASVGTPIRDKVTGLAIDSEDRVLYEVQPFAEQLQRIMAVDPVTGLNLTVGGFVTPTAATENYVGYAELERYSDRHFVFLYNNSNVSTVFGVMATDVPAPAPKNVTAANPGTGSTLSLDWAMPNDPEVVGVNVFRSTSAGTLGAQVNASLITGTTYIDASLTTGQAYFYTVRSQATDPFNSSSYASVNINQVSATPALILPPNPPTGMSAADTTKGGEVLLTWTNPPLYAEKINIYRSTTAGDIGAVVHTVNNAVANAAETYLDSGLTNGTPYFYTIKGVNGKNEESSNTAQLAATPTDTTKPVFAGVKSGNDYGFPGVRLAWESAVDNSAVTYNIYASPTTDVNLVTPVATTTAALYDLTTIPFGKDSYIIVRAKDAFGNEDTNTAVFVATPNRVITDSDKNGGINYAKFNPRPDAAFPAMLPVPIGAGKGSPADLPFYGFADGVYFHSPNSVKTKARFTLTIPAAGKYDISVWLAPSPALFPIAAAGYTYHLTYPNAITEDFVIDQAGTNLEKWNLLTSKVLTAGTLTVIGDSSSVFDSNANLYHVSGAIRALASVAPKMVDIYRASSPITIDGVITPAEWAGAKTIEMGRAWQKLGASTWTGLSDYSGTIRLKWDNTNLYFSADVTDNIVHFMQSADVNLWDRDSLEIYLGFVNPQDPARVTYDNPGDYQIIIGANDATNDALWVCPQAPLNISGVPPGNNVKVVKTAAGYIMEGRLPWLSLDGQTSAPVQGQVIGFCLMSNDNDVTAPLQQSALSLSGLGGLYNTPANWIQATLQGTPPVPVAGDVDGNGVAGLQFHRDLPRGDFLGLLRDTAVLIGNSSSGIIEAASFGTPVIDVGDRQKGRERGPNVRNVPFQIESLRKAITEVWNGGVPARFPRDNVYGGGATGEKIAKILARVPLDDRLRRKLIAF